jgi:hypothetical protein
MKHTLYIKNYEHRDGAKLWGYIWKFNIKKIVTVLA